MRYRGGMRRHLLWYGIAVCWAIAGIAGILRHHTPQAAPALLFALFFAVIGYWIGKRDEAAKQRRGVIRKR